VAERAEVVGLNLVRGVDVLSVVSVMCSQDGSIFRPTGCDALLFVISEPQESGGTGPRWAVAPEREEKGVFRSFIN
jgi:hypothetical protein